jgi:hypothetical protein
MLLPFAHDALAANDRVCGDLLSVGQSPSTTLLTIGRPAGVEIDRVNERGRPAPLLTSYALLDVSTTDVLLVAPLRQAPLPPSGPAASPDDPDPPPISVFATALFAIDSGTGPIDYTDGDGPFLLDRVLAWAPDASTALVTGRIGQRTGLWLLDTAIDGGIGEPRFLRPVVGSIAAAAGPGGEFLVVNDGAITRMRDGSETTLPLPPGAPLPHGAVVWVP